MRRCEYCGNALALDSDTCGGCGAKHEIVTQPQQPSAPSQPQYQQQNHQPQHPSPQAKNKAIASLVLGICAMVVPIPVLDIVAAIIGIVFANQAKSLGYRGGLQIGGLVCSIIGLIWSIGFTCTVCAGLLAFV